jgi:hypothetical protein
METTTYVQKTAFTPTMESVSINCISWGAIIAGVFAALSCAALLNLLGLGLDLLTFSTGKETLHEISVLSIIWLVLSSIISMLAGGWIAGRMAGSALASEGVLHGLITWAVTAILTFILVTTSVGAIVGVMATLIGNSIVLAEQTSINQNTANLNSGTSAADNNAQRLNIQQQPTETVKISGEKVEQTLGIAALIIFVSYLISAIASAFGGLWGAMSDRKIFLREIRTK